VSPKRGANTNGLHCLAGGLCRESKTLDVLPPVPHFHPTMTLADRYIISTKRQDTNNVQSVVVGDERKEHFFSGKV